MTGFALEAGTDVGFKALEQLPSCPSSSARLHKGSSAVLPALIHPVFITISFLQKVFPDLVFLR